MRTNEPPTGARYRCAHCQRIVRRVSTKRWVKSWCDRTNRRVHLMRLSEED